MLILIESLRGATLILLLTGKVVAGAVEVALEVEHQVFSHLQVEPDDRLTGNPLIAIGGDVEG